MKPMNQAWNRSGSSSRNTRLNVSWLGTPCSSLKNSCKNSSFDRPNSAMSAQVSPPLSSVQNPITRISCSSCRFAFPVRGSSKSSKISSNSSMAPHPPLSVPFGRILPTPPAQYIFSNAIPLDRPRSVVTGPATFDILTAKIKNRQTGQWEGDMAWVFQHALAGAALITATLLAPPAVAQTQQQLDWCLGKASATQ